MAIADDFQIAVGGDIRYTGTTANHTVIAFHRWLGDLMDDAQASGNDILDITNATASARSTDNIIQLNAPFNIDDVAAQHLYDGSVVQANGDEIYDGVLVFAPAATPLQIIQNALPVSPNFWDTTLNPDAGAGISHRFMVKVRTAAADIDQRKLLGQTREVGFSYSEFPTTTVRGNNVLALTHAADLNNATAEATIRGWTTVVNITEGYIQLDVNNDTALEPYYSQWDLGSQTINDFYERHKWLHRESTIEDSHAGTGTDFAFANATVIGQAQSYANGVNAQLVTRVRTRMKKTLAPTGAITCVIYAHSGVFGTSSIPTGAALATSVAIQAEDLTLAFKEYEFEFTTQFNMVASTNYVVAFEHAVIDASNFVSIDGVAASGHGGNQSSLVTVTWTPAAASDLWFEVYASPQQYGLPGEVFRGPTHDITVDTPTGTMVEPELLTWTEATVASSGQLLAIDSTTAATKAWIQLLTGIRPEDGTVLTGATGTVTVNVTILNRTVSAPSVGLSTGSSIVGAYGLGMQTADLTASDKLTDLDDVLRLPPNNVTFTVSGLVTTVDRVLVAPLGFSFAFDNEASGPFVIGETVTFTSPAGTGYVSEIVSNPDNTGRMNCRLLTGVNPADNSTMAGGTSFATADVNGAVANSEDQRQLKLATTLVSGTETAVVSVDVIPTDTPTAGTIRIQLNSGIFRRQAYLSYTGSTFTITSADYSGILTATGGAVEAGNSMYVSYVDEAAPGAQSSFTSVFFAARNLFIRVRDGVVDANGPIKTFETTGVLGTAGGSATAIRTPDS